MFSLLIILATLSPFWQNGAHNYYRHTCKGSVAYSPSWYSRTLTSGISVRGYVVAMLGRLPWLNVLVACESSTQESFCFSPNHVLDRVNKMPLFVPIAKLSQFIFSNPLGWGNKERRKEKKSAKPCIEKKLQYRNKTKNVYTNIIIK